MSRSKKNRGEAAFDHYFSGVYGDRWPSLKKSLLDSDCKVARKNTFYSEAPEIDQILSLPEKYGVGESTALANCFAALDVFSLDNFETPLLPFYRMDPASIVAAQALPLKPGMSVLDMCAAPGGKSLVLFESMGGEGHLLVNELSARRRFRLMSVIKRYLPPEKRSLIEIGGRDGARFGMGQKRFDGVLLDAPCSGERGVVRKASDLERWSEKRSRRFAIQQYSLLASALLCCQVGGHILYSTCSLSPFENDGVIAKALNRQGDHFEVVSLPDLGGEATEYGRMFLPDELGWGPIYYCLLRRI